MSLINAYTEWQEYCARELAVLTPELLRLGYSLDNTQPHLSGETLSHAGYDECLGPQTDTRGATNYRRYARHNQVC